MENPRGAMSFEQYNMALLTWILTSQVRLESRQTVV